MHQEKDNTEDRAAKFSKMQRSFEEYLTEVVSSNHDMRIEEMQKMVYDNLQRSMKASSDYHAQVINDYEKANEFAKANYHKLMSQIYGSIFK